MGKELNMDERLIYWKIVYEKRKLELMLEGRLPRLDDILLQMLVTTPATPKKAREV